MNTVYTYFYVGSAYDLFIMVLCVDFLNLIPSSVISLASSDHGTNILERGIKYCGHNCLREK